MKDIISRSEVNKEICRQCGKVHKNALCGGGMASSIKEADNSTDWCIKCGKSGQFKDGICEACYQLRQ